MLKNHRIFSEPSVAAALTSAILFGASTPIAKAFVGHISPIFLAGLLYLGSGIGLMLLRLIRDKGFKKIGVIKK